MRGREQAAGSTLVLALGAFSILAQTLVLREYLVVYGGNEIALGLFFGSWLFWVGAGAVAAGRIGRRIDPGASLAPLALAYAAAPLVQMSLVRSLRLLTGVDPMEMLPLDRLAAVTFATNAPVSLLTGALFTVASAAAAAAAGASGGAGEAGVAEEKRRSVTRVYLLEAAGGCLGGATATGLAWAGARPLAVLLGASAALAVPVLAFCVATGRRRQAAAAVAILAAGAALLLTPAGAAIERWTIAQRWRATLPQATLVESFDTPYRNVSLARLGSQEILLFDGSIAAVFPAGTETAADAALVMGESRGARRVLLFGLADPSIACAILRYDVERMVVVEADHVMVDRMRALIPAGVGSCLSDPRVEVVTADPREWAAVARDRFGLVLVRTPDPDTAQINRLFTIEFMRAAASLLEPGGVFSTRVTSAENYMGSEIERYGRSVYATLSAAFPEVVVTPGENAMFLAARDPGTLTDDPGEIAERWQAIRPAGSGFQPEMFASILDRGRLETTRAVYARERGPGEPPLVDTDARPITHFARLLVIAATLDSRLPEILGTMSSLSVWILIVPIAIFLLLGIRRSAINPPPGGTAGEDAAALAGAAGFVSISMDIVLLQAFQSRLGSLFVDAGLANALFMGGMAAGVAAGRAILRRERDRTALALLLAGATCAATLALPHLAEAAQGRPGFAALFVALGALAGATFPAAGAIHPSTGDARGLASLLEASDHWGGAVGGAATGLVLLPLLGTRGTCGVLAATLAAAIVLVAADSAIAASRPGSALALVISRMRSLAPRSPFPWRGTSTLIAGTALSALALGWIVRGKVAEGEPRIPESTARAAAGGAAVVERLRPLPHFVVSPTGEAQGGVIVGSKTVAPDVVGYGGPLGIVVMVRRDGTLGRVMLVESDETPAYAGGLDSWLASSFEGKPASEPFLLRGKGGGRSAGDDGVDAITGATISSRAAVETVNRTAAAGASLLGIAPAESPPPDLASAWNDPTAIYLIAAFALAIALYLRGFPRGSPWPRRAFLAANLALGGFVFNAQLSMDHVVRILSSSWPSPWSPVAFVLVTGASLLAVAFGPVYCAYICPFGAAQEILSLAGLCTRPRATVERRGRYVRYVVLAAFLVAWALTGSGSLVAADPLLQFFSGKAPAAILAVGVAALAVSLFHFRFWCRTFCPVGAILSIAGRIGAAIRIAPRKRYEACDLGATCDRDIECLHCNRCLTGSAIARGKPGLIASRIPAWGIDAFFQIAAAAIGIALVVMVATGVPNEQGAGAAAAAAGDGEAGEAATGKPRDVDMDRLRSLIGRGKLSDQEALYWEQADGRER